MIKAVDLFGLNSCTQRLGFYFSTNGSNAEYVWLWIAVEPTDKIILGIRISIERTMLVAEQFIQSLVRRYGKQKISTDGGTWYPQAYLLCLLTTTHIRGLRRKFENA